MKVMKKKCPTCPFRKNAKGHYDVPWLAMELEATLLNVSRICHHPRLHGSRETHLCRGGRDQQLEIFYRMRFINAPTDEAWDAKRAELGI